MNNFRYKSGILFEFFRTEPVEQISKLIHSSPDSVYMNPSLRMTEREDPLQSRMINSKHGNTDPA